MQNYANDLNFTLTYDALSLPVEYIQMCLPPSSYNCTWNMLSTVLLPVSFLSVLQVALSLRKPTREAQGSADQSMKKPILVSRPIK